jgi:hypothetical protein
MSKNQNLKKLLKKIVEYNQKYFQFAGDRNNGRQKGTLSLFTIVDLFCDHIWSQNNLINTKYEIMVTTNKQMQYIFFKRT